MINFLQEANDGGGGGGVYVPHPLTPNDYHMYMDNGSVSKINQLCVCWPNDRELNFGIKGSEFESFVAWSLNLYC